MIILRGRNIYEEEHICEGGFGGVIAADGMRRYAAAFAERSGGKVVLHKRAFYVA